MAPPTLAPEMLWPPCDVPKPKSDCGCGCGGHGGCGEGAKGLVNAVRTCPLWVWLLAVAIVLLAGNEKASGPSRARRTRGAR